MVKQWGLGQSNQNENELTQKGTNIRRKAGTKSGAAGAAQQAERSASLLAASVTWLTASWPGGYSDGSAVVSTVRSCDDLVVRNRHVVLNWPLPRPHLSASSWDPASSLKARTVVVGAWSVTRPLTGDNCAVGAHSRELRRLNRCLPITARGRHV